MDGCMVEIFQGIFPSNVFSAFIMFIVLLIHFFTLAGDGYILNKSLLCEAEAVSAAISARSTWNRG